MRIRAPQAIPSPYETLIFANTVYHSLAAVNFFLGCVGLIQTSRILLYRSSLKGDSVGQEAKEAAKEEGATGKKILEDPVGAAKNAAKN